MNSYLAKLSQAQYLAPWMFWLLPLVVVFFVVAVILMPKQKLAVLIRAAAFSLLIVALADPVQVDSSSSSELAAVFDVSASISQGASQSMAEAILEYSKEENRKLKLFPFAKTGSKLPIIIDENSTSDEIVKQIRLSSVALDRGETNLGAAVKEALMGSRSSSILVFSDGNETLGNSTPVVQEAARRGVSLYPIVPNQKEFIRDRLYISSLQAPLTARAGTQTEIGVSIKNDFSENMPTRVTLYLDDEKLLSKEITVAGKREKLLSLKSPTLEGGLKRIRAVLEPLDKFSESKKIELHRWISVKESSKLLLISGEQSDERVIKSLIQQKGYGIQAIVANGQVEIPTKLNKFSSVILNNAAKRQLPRGFLSSLRKFVENGGGLLLLGGNRSFGLGDYIGTDLEKISPLKFVPPQTKKRRLTSAVILVLDKSGSMVHQGKILAAKRAALMSVEALKDEDFVSVIGFDHAPFVIIDLQRVSQAKPIAESRLRNLTAVGKTNLLPALAAARQKLKTVNVSRKHIIVLSDGKFPLSSDLYVDEINRLRKDNVSVSAVALGLEADIPFMKILAKYGKGAFYQTLDPNRLPQIFVQDIKVSTGEKTLQENRNFSVAVGPGGLASTKVRKYRPLRGFVETLPKRGSRLELITKRREKAFPIMASWRFGKGKVIAFTSDTNGRWSLPWLSWNDFPVFWGDVIDSVRDKSGKKPGDLDFDLRYSINRKAIDLDLAIFDSSLETAGAPKITAQIIDPGGELSSVSFSPKTKGRFSSTIENARPGDYKVRITYGETELPPLALTLTGDIFGEAPGRGVNMANLENIAALTKGSLNPLASQVRTAARKLESSEHLFIPLVVLAFILVLLEAFVRELWSIFRFVPKSAGGASNQNKPLGKYSVAA